MDEVETLEQQTALEASAGEPEGGLPVAPPGRGHVRVAPGRRYFVTEDGAPWLAIGHNEALTWPALRPLLEGDRGAAEAYLRRMAAHGVTVLRVMLEYFDARSQLLFESPAGVPRGRAVGLWDELIALCESTGVRLLLTFWDSFWLWERWKDHPYSRPGSGFDGPSSFCTSETAFATQARRVRFVADRWGGSPAIFAYDLMNEIHPCWGGSPEDQERWIARLAALVREREMERWGRRHLLTVSKFEGILDEPYQRLILRHPDLDFASTHVYAKGRIDDPTNTVDCALAMREAVEFAFAKMGDARPFTDSEHGPIHAFMDRRKPLAEGFDDEYFRHMAWAHLATGGAGGGLRWPFRRPHGLTPGMHRAQRGMARFIAAAPLDWPRFSPRPLRPGDARLRPLDPLGAGAPPVLVFGCADDSQALLWLLGDRRDRRAGSARLPLPRPTWRSPRWRRAGATARASGTRVTVRRGASRGSRPTRRASAGCGCPPSSATWRSRCGAIPKNSGRPESGPLPALF